MAVGEITNEGEDIALKALVNHTAGQNLVLRLFKNNFTPADASVAGDFTEATFTGYAALTLTGASWVATPGAPSSIAYAQQTFTSSANQTAQTIYGYYLTQASSGKVVGAQLFTNPRIVENLNDLIKVTPTLTMKDTSAAE